jgi:hypothetical protein
VSGFGEADRARRPKGDLDAGAVSWTMKGEQEAFELAALTEEIFMLAPNVLAKHRWVNRGWVAAGTSLVLLLAAAVSVVIAT